MSEIYSYDSRSLEASGRIIPLPFIILTILMGAIIIIAPITSSKWRSGNITQGMWTAFFIFILAFIFFLALSLFFLRKVTLKISENGITYQKGKRIKSLFWSQVKDIKTEKTYIFLIFNLGLIYSITIFGDDEKITFDSDIPIDTKQFFLAIALVFKYAGLYKIPFNDTANLLKRKEFVDIGFTFPGLKDRGKYFMKPEPVRFKPKQVIVTIPCPECTEMVIPMRIGRCPKCGYKFN